MHTLFGNNESAQDSRRLALWWVEGILLTLGLLLVGWYAWNTGAAAFDQSWSNYEFNAELQGRKPTFGDYVQQLLKGGEADVEPKPPAAAAESADRPSPQATVQPGQIVGRIEIPRLSISAIVKSGVDDTILSRAVGHVPQTALPGEPGNVGIAAHRDTYFRNLRGVQPGDIIRMVTTTGSYEYKVDSLKIVRPSQVEVLDPTPKPAMTLVTCYPFNYVGHAPKRFIVRATQVGADSAAAVTAESLHKEAAIKPVAKKKRVKAAAIGRRRSS